MIVDLGFARREVVDAAVGMAREQGRTTGELLVESRAIRPDQLARALAERFGVDYVDLALFPVDPDAVALLDIKLAKRYRALPVGLLRFLPSRIRRPERGLGERRRGDLPAPGDRGLEGDLLRRACPTS